MESSWLLQFRLPHRLATNHLPSANDKRVFTFLSIFGMPPMHYDRRSHRIICTTARRNWTFIGLLIYTACAIVLFVRVQIRHLFISKRLLSIFSDTVRTLSMAYAFQSLIAVALRKRQQYADFFNFLYQLDVMIAAQLHRWPDCSAPRRKFWRHSGLWLANHVLIAWPLEMYFWHGQRLEFKFFLVADSLAAIGIGLTTFFLEFAAYSCQVRYACLCECLRKALYAGIDVESGDSAADVRASIGMLCELDTAKELLNGSGFGTLLTLKLLIDGLTVITSVHFAIYKLLNHSALDKLHTFFTYAFFQFPYIVANVLMVQHYKAIGDQVREIILLVFVGRYIRDFGDRVRIEGIP